MAYATPADIELRLGRELDDSEATIVNTRLGDAELLIRSRMRDLDSKVTSGALDVAVVVMVESDAVLRLIRNLDGYSTETDGNYSYTIDQRVASGRLSILDEEWTLLGVRRSVFVLAPRVDIPWACEADRRPDSGAGHDQNHPAVWWGD